VQSGVLSLAVCRAAYAALALCAAAVAPPAAGRDADDLEVPAGESFLLFANPSDEVFGFSGNSAMWIRDTPVLGDYFAQIFWNGIEDAVYAGLGLTIRLMPHWDVAPFAGVGGSYNCSLGANSGEDDAGETPDGELPDRGDSYWGGHVEAGVRFRAANRWSMFEVMVRYTWSSLDGDRDTWIAGIGAGTGRAAERYW
jgi:hypothetical protein